MNKPQILESILVLFLCLSVLPSLAAGIDVITSDNYADAGVAQVLGAKLNAKVIKLGWGEAAKTGTESTQTANETYILGGTSALPAFAGSSELPQIKARFQGKDRYETASLAALLWNSSESIVVAYGYDEEGIESAKNIAVANNAPLLLAGQKELSAPTESAVEVLKPKKAFLVSSPDMIQNYIISSLKAKGVEKVELVQQNHREKTSKLIEKANSAIGLSKSLQNESEIAKQLIAEAERELSLALDYFNSSFYNYAFEHAALARYRAETAEKIKRGMIKITFTQPPAKEEKNLNETLKIADVLLNPQQYEGKKVKLSGKIEEAIEIKSNAYLKIFDGTGRIMVTFSATKEFILSKGWLFLVEQDIIGKEIEVEGVVKINVPISPHGEPAPEHGAFAYLIYAENIKLKKEK